ncbi:DEHA2F22396p [Debaryomyces hansenii CBS767]|uniref:DEHA2F22396p n=1 Tax=Debaryomyces hansenii (strain ATCC 36239 / CBS 767 / BCRC 21394 / JCM 1990 / NBRC 0083 / IGC 2968) TaxID=284592 RepID=B5RUL8_DEBHA|nr:DEHA2F22396p [Debaryomyces hansenii CBS767]CAR66396.1 DEHA2F22396p [Debaryomyces hansenii CBS767]|eukprot:XP_002770878.1 DEHA2F22396p [Debaryomyces hansenii CBS767]
MNKIHLGIINMYIYIYIYMDCSIQGNMAQSGETQMWNHLRVMQAHLVNNHPWCKIPLLPAQVSCISCYIFYPCTMTCTSSSLHKLS